MHGGGAVVTVKEGIEVTDVVREGQRPHRFQLDGEARGRGRVSEADMEELCLKLRPILGEDAAVEAKARRIVSAPELPAGVEGLSRKRRGCFEVDVSDVVKNARERLREELSTVGELLSKCLLVDGKAKKGLLARVVRQFAGPGYMHLFSMLVHRMMLTKLDGFDEKAGFTSADARRFRTGLRQHRNSTLLKKFWDLLEKHEIRSAKNFLDALRVACLYAEARVGWDLASPKVLNPDLELGCKGLNGNGAKAMTCFEKKFAKLRKLTGGKVRRGGGGELTGGELKISREGLEEYCSKFGTLPTGVHFPIDQRILDASVPEAQVLPMVAASKVIADGASRLDADVIANFLERLDAADGLVENFELTDGDMAMSLPELLESQRPQTLLALLDGPNE